MLTISPCNLCPRECGVDRNNQAGFCRSGPRPKLARAALHFGEEPCISGIRGSGTIFFSGCNLRCCYCQNYQISREGRGKTVTTERLAEIYLELQTQGAHNLNLVTATPYLPSVLKAIELARPKLQIPVVYNTSGYEKVETIRELEGYVDVYLPDFKYYNNELAWKYSHINNYLEAATAAIAEMIRQIRELRFDDQGIMQKGIIIRHLVLPGSRKDSLAILRWVGENLPLGRYWLSLMSQYTPASKSPDHPEINRRITTFEYASVVEEALRLGLINGYIQNRSSARKEYTPPFDLEGI
ncbi:MAG: radical SAM protein [Syntrophomonadaceae bacterium]|nr:radical SAM protein [Syntrophomonadaceae bacterium]